MIQRRKSSKISINNGHVDNNVVLFESEENSYNGDGFIPSMNGGVSFANLSIDGDQEEGELDEELLTKKNKITKDQSSGEKKFTPLRWWINVINLTLMVVSSVQIALSGIVIASSYSYFIGGIYTGVIGFLSSMYPTNHLKYLPVEWVVMILHF